MEYRYATAADAPAMAELFAANHHDALTEQQRAAQGFVQGDFDAPTLRTMAEAGTLLIATDSAHLAGLLALAAPHQIPTPPPPVQALLKAQHTLKWRNRPLSETRWLFYGPVVVAAAYRGKGVARALYSKARETASPQAEALVAFIELSNESSWKVHVNGFGMTPVGDFAVGDRTYGVVAAPTSGPAQSGT